MRALVLILVSVALVWPQQSHAQQQPVPVQKFGWAGQQAAKQVRQRVARELPKLEVPAQGATTEGQYVCLWHFAKPLNGGKHFENIPQEIGDCVSWGYKHGVEYSLATMLAVGQTDNAFRYVFSPYIYGVSRVQIGERSIRGDGSIGAWAALGIQRYGVIAVDEKDCPPYSGSLARKWGWSGPPEAFLTIGKTNPCEARLVTSWEALCFAISNGWAVPVCSDAGFGKMVEANGRIEGRWNTTWPHCMCFIGFDARQGREAAYCLNSWGPDAHARPSRYAELDGAPPGGFWVLRKDVERMLSEEDTYAISFNGFRKQDLFGWIRKQKEKGAKDETSTVRGSGADVRPAGGSERSERSAVDQGRSAVWFALAA